MRQNILGLSMVYMCVCVFVGGGVGGRRVMFLQVNLLASNITGRLKSETMVLKSVLLTGACEQRAHMHREEEDTKHKHKTRNMVPRMNNRNVKKDYSRRNESTTGTPKMQSLKTWDTKVDFVHTPLFQAPTVWIFTETFCDSI